MHGQQDFEYNEYIINTSQNNLSLFAVSCIQLRQICNVSVGFTDSRGPSSLPEESMYVICRRPHGTGTNFFARNSASPFQCVSTTDRKKNSLTHHWYL
jgi:hypothetical protein